MPPKGLLPLLALLMATTSCDRATRAVRGTKELAKEGLEWSKQKAKNRLERMADHLFFTCHPNTPDTDRNKMRFHEYFKPALVPDAHEIYAYTDYMGIDYVVMFSFRCDTTSLARIIRDNDLELYQDSTGMNPFPCLGNSWDLEWWDESKLKMIRPFVRGVDQQDRLRLWYDSLEHRATYQQFSL